jgi:hypothetical protein
MLGIGSDALNSCEAIDGVCHVDFDGYCFAVLMCLLYGIVWIYFSKSKLKQLQATKPEEWSVSSSLSYSRNE